MLHDVTAATHKGGYLIEIEFDDGSRGVVDFSRYLTRGGVFKRFNDPADFSRFTVDEETGTLTWGDEVDIAPESLYAQATGTGLPAWMESDQEEANLRCTVQGVCEPIGSEALSHEIQCGT